MLKRYKLILLALTALLLYACFKVKSSYFNFPYPNAVEYLASIFLLVYTLGGLFWKTGRKVKMLLGVLSICILMLSVNLLNYIYEWHPLTLVLPFGTSQSFKVDYEPFEWNLGDEPEAGYDSDTLNAYYSKLDEWKRLRALLVVKDEKLVIEKYFKGVDKYDAFNVHSITKSITSALIGIAIERGDIRSEEENVMEYFPEYQYKVESAKSKLTIAHLLSMKGGFDYWDDYKTPKECLLDIQLYKPPGEHFKYFTGSQAILSAIITKATKKPTKDFAKEYFLQPIGVKNAFWRKQGEYYCGGGESYYTARDLARIGQVYLNKGKVELLQVLNEDWVTKSFTNYTDSSKYFRTLDDYTEVGYGYCWWLLKYKNQIIYTARGKGGQYILIIPEQKTVIVILQEWNLHKDFNTENRLLCDLLSIVCKPMR